MLSLVELVQFLQRQQLVSIGRMNKLRRLADASLQEFTPRVALLWLLEQGELKPQQIQELIGPLDPDLVAQVLKKPAGDLAPLRLEELATPPTPPAPIKPAVAAPPPTPIAAPLDDGLSLVDLPATTPAPPKNVSRPVPVAAPAAPPPVPVAAAATNIIDELFADPQLAARALAPSASMLDSPGQRRAASTWDSPLMLIGGGALLLLAIVSGVLIWSMNRESGDEILAQADQNYRQGSYAQAIHQYEYFLGKFSQHARVSYARVQRGTAQLRRAVESGGDGSAALSTARTVLGEITGEPNFADGRPELAAMLPQIAESLARAAVANPSSQTITQAQEALTLALKPQLVPEALRPTVKLQETEATIQLAKRRSEQNDTLGATIGEIRGLIASGKGTEGYALRKQLLQAYPELRGSPQLREAVGEISVALRDSVQFKPEELSPSAPAASPVPIHSTVLVAPLTASASPQRVAPALVHADGSVYGVDVGNGRVLWRRYIGLQGAIASGGVDTSSGKTGVVFDGVKQQLLHVDALTGTTHTQLTIPTGLDAPALPTRAALWCPARDGRLWAVDPLTLKASGALVFPQRLGVAPAVDQREQWLVQLGEHSNLYIVSLADRRCLEAYYLGHESAQAVVPPLVVAQKILVVLRQPNGASKLVVLATDEQGTNVKPAQEILLAGRISTPLALQGRNVFAVTDFGGLFMFEITNNTTGDVLKKLAEFPEHESLPVNHHLLTREGRTLVAGRELTEFEAQAARGRLAPGWNVKSLGDALAPPQLIGEQVIVATRSALFPGILISGVDVRSGKVAWSSRVASPIAGWTVTNDSRLNVITTDGSCFAIDPTKPTRVVEATAQVPFARPAQRTTAQVGEQLALWFKGADVPRDRQLALVNMSSGKVDWPAVSDVIAAAPTRLNNELLVPLRCGQVELIATALSANPRSLPFQSEVAAGVDYPWTRAVPSAANQFVIADGRSRLFTVQLNPGETTSLSVLRQAMLADPPSANPVVLDNHVLLVDQAQHFTSYKLADLTVVREQRLSDRLAWGPFAMQVAGKNTIVAQTFGGEVLELNAAGEATLMTTLREGDSLVGEPLLDIVATSSGLILNFMSRTELKTIVNVEQPLDVGPIVVQKQIIAGGRDGSIHWFNAPSGP